MRMRTAVILIGSAIVCVVLIHLILGSRDIARNEWTEPVEGIEICEYRLSDSIYAALPPEVSSYRYPVYIFRIDPQKHRPEVFMYSDTEQKRWATPEWVEKYGLIFAVNMGMFNADMSNCGYAQKDEHIDSQDIVNDYKSAYVLDPKRPGLPAFDLVDLDVTPLDSLKARYATVIQLLRLMKHPGKDVWSPTDKRWSEACIAKDIHGNMLIVFCRTPFTMPEFNRILTEELPCDIVAAAHLEGGPEAQIFFLHEKTKFELIGCYATDFVHHDRNHSFLRIPNVIGIRYH